MQSFVKGGSAVILVILVILVFCRGALVEPQVAVAALEAAGYSNVVVKEHIFLFVGLRGGDRQDAALFTCRATNPAGKEVTVYVTSGWPFKGAAIRYK